MPARRKIWKCCAVCCVLAGVATGYSPGPWARWGWSTWRSPPGCSCRGTGSSRTAPPAPAAAARWSGSAGAAAASSCRPCPGCRCGCRWPRCSGSEPPRGLQGLQVKSYSGKTQFESWRQIKIILCKTGGVCIWIRKLVDEVFIFHIVYSRVIIRLNKYNLYPYPYSISYEDTLIQQHNEYQYDRSCWAHPCHLFHCCVTCHVSRGCVTTQWRGRAGRDSAQKLRWTKYFIANVTRPDLTFYWFAAMLEWVLMVAVWDIL